jgi:hypothetical protein
VLGGNAPFAETRAHLLLASNVLRWNSCVFRAPATVLDAAQIRDQVQSWNEGDRARTDTMSMSCLHCCERRASFSSESAKERLSDCSMPFLSSNSAFKAARLREAPLRQTLEVYQYDVRQGAHLLSPFTLSAAIIWLRK